MVLKNVQNNNNSLTFFNCFFPGNYLKFCNLPEGISELRMDFSRTEIGIGIKKIKNQTSFTTFFSFIIIIFLLTSIKSYKKYVHHQIIVRDLNGYR